MVDSDGIRLGIVRGVSYGLFGEPDEFVPQMRALGASLLRVYVYWGQVEPEPGRFDWRVVDAFLAQLNGSEEVWVTVCASSRWATRQPTDFLPPSPAHDAGTYARFVRELVTHCSGRIHYWQCENEPSNTDLLWSGTAEEYVAHLATFSTAVRAADPNARVVLGGCGFDVLSSEPEGPPRRFFAHVLEHGRDAFDWFSVHLYDAPERIPEHVATVRALMQKHGYERPVVVGEYNGPTLFAFEEVGALLQECMMAAFAGDGGAALDVATLTAPKDESPDRRAMRLLYARKSELPPQARMFMLGCEPELEAKRHRINSREIVTRTVLALSVGVRRTVCWNLAPEVPNYSDPYNLMGFLFGKLALMDYAGVELNRRHPAAQAFQRLARYLDGADEVQRLAVAGRPDVFAFVVSRPDRAPLQILWKRGDPFHGEEEPSEPFRWIWPHATLHVVDAFGTTVEAEPDAGKVLLPLSVTPLFVSAGR